MPLLAKFVFRLLLAQSLVEGSIIEQEQGTQERQFAKGIETEIRPAIGRHKLNLSMCQQVVGEISRRGFRDVHIAKLSGNLSDSHSHKLFFSS